MIRKPITFTIGLIFVGFLFVLIPAKDVLAGQCQVQMNFQAQPNPVAENGTLTLNGYVKLEGSVWEPPGTPNAGYCVVGTYPLKEIKVSIQSSKFPGALANKLVSVKSSDIGPYPYSFSWAPSSVNLKSGSSFDVYAAALGYNGEIYQQLTKSSSINVNVKASTYKTYACIADNGKYACDPKNDPNCSNVPNNVCQGKPCGELNDNSLCGEPAPSSATHKECRDKACKVVLGAGSSTCSTDANCVATGGGPTMTKYVFDLKNPIGVENFQDLVNIIGKWIFNLAIPIAVIIIIYAGVLMLTAGGVPARFQKGAKALWYAVIGLAIVLIGKGFVTLIQSILSLRE